MLWNLSVWQYKWRKLAHVLAAQIAYAKIYSKIRLQKWKDPSCTFIGILLAEHLGDIVAAEPIIDALSKKYPNSKINWIIKPAFRALLENHPKINCLIDEHSVIFSTYITQKHPFDVFYNLHLNDLRSDPFFPGQFLINEKAIAKGLSKSNYLHTNNLLELVSQLADLGKIGGYPKIYLESKAAKPEIKQPYWIIHRKSNAQMRDWQDHLWCQLIDQIIAENEVAIIEVGSIEPLNYKSPKFQSLVGKTSLKETLNIIKHAEYFIGVESGPAHIANAFRIPALILCGRFVNFNQYNVYSGAYQNDGIAHIVFNQKGSASELTFEDVYKQLPQKNIA
jgi:heptosyltransferase-3